MTLPRLAIDGLWFREPSGRRVLLRGVNLGGDTKVPATPDQRTNFAADFADHRTVSFVGRPFPLSEAAQHFGRLAHWGFNCLRLLTTWEAVEHEGPSKYDTTYLDYLTEITRLAGEYGFYVFIDFHQDAWSRMSGGDGAPGWTFEAVGLDFTKFHASGAAHVMQHKYDYAKGGRQDAYPQMTWSQNYRLPGNAIMWTLFFAGNAFAPDFRIEGQTAQDYLQGHYLGAMRAIAERVKDMDHVLGFDTLNEPSLGWIGKELSHQHVERTPQHPEHVRPGAAWSPLDGLMAALGETREVPVIGFDTASMKMKVTHTETVNPDGVKIWRDGASDPFAAAYVNGTRENYFTHDGVRAIDPEADFMVPFFNAVAETIRPIRSDWLVFAEMDPFKTFSGATFPPGTPADTVNASHWYDVVTLTTKTFMFPVAFNPFSGRTLEGADAIRNSYVNQLGRYKAMSEAMPGGGAPALIGEFGIPYDLDGGAAYKAWAAGDRSAAPWASHVQALTLMYDALDELLLHSTQWNYTASNRNDLAIGDGWNQEDLSIWSADQATGGNDPDSGGRAVAGFARPYVRVWAGRPIAQRFNSETGAFRAELTVETGIGDIEVYAPSRVYPGGPEVLVEGPGKASYDPVNQLLRITPKGEALLTVHLTRKPG
ncbi:MAG: cellulase family glycosylhydrolase [Micropepsaceae bacterium]